MICTSACHASGWVDADPVATIAEPESVLQLHRRSLLGHGDDDDSRSHGKGSLDWGRTGPDTDVVFAQASCNDASSQHD
jgi:hypothetical protein